MTMMMTMTTDDAEAITVLLNRYHDALTAWEVDFLESVGNQEWISAKQKATLDRIWDRVVNRA